ncbi:Component of the BRCA1-A complex [Thoreauomyces humboldtii]|nr:Component of the BRCA1-A complex [Thoreauomyces humboldtii]
MIHDAAGKNRTGRIQKDASLYQKPTSTLGLSSRYFVSITRLEHTKRLLKRFIFQKSRLNSKHEFGICTITDMTLWHQDCTSHTETLMAAIDDLRFEDQRFPMWDVSTVFSAISDKYPTPTSSHTLRVIIIYCRSDVVPSGLSEDHAIATFRDNPDCYLDGIYLHSRPSTENSVQVRLAWYKAFCPTSQS